jgi:carboxylate-amine ligase
MAFTIGIEEEFFLFERESGDAVRTASHAFLAECRRRCGAQVQREMLQCQLEIVSAPHARVGDVIAELAVLRREIDAIGAVHDVAIAAAGTNPLADWRAQSLTAKPRYAEIRDDLGIIGLRNLVCGMHVHVALPDNVDRVMVMNRLIPYLPLLFALSTSSPFWDGRPTGLRAYRLAAYRELPRTGLPPALADSADYDAYVAALVAAGAMPDSSHVWWAVRPSLRYPTLELRVTDSCTSLGDVAAVAALYQCLVAEMSARGAAQPQTTPLERAIAEENLWRVQRHGLDAPFIDGPSGGVASARECLAALRMALEPRAQALDCAGELARLDGILRRGTSADRQIAIYEAQRADGVDDVIAAHAVARWLVNETAAC